MLGPATRRRLVIVLVFAPIALGAMAFRYYISSLYVDPPLPGKQAESASDAAQHARPSQDKPGILVNDSRAFPGYTLLAPLAHRTTYLLDMEGRIVHTWQSDCGPGLSAYLLEDGHLLRTGHVQRHPLAGVAGAGGRIQEFTWDGKLVWDFKWPSAEQVPHHDICRLPNGNVLMIVWEKKTRKEAIAAGRRPETAGEAYLLPCCIFEVKPAGKTTAEVVWQWHVWDHLVQDHDSAKANFGDVAAHPERIDINFGKDVVTALAAKDRGLSKLRSLGYVGSSPGQKLQKVDPDWTHINSVAYNAELDQIMLSVHAFSEIWIIDHSTTTVQAAGHSGGRSGKGGDLLYRWGNPRAHRAGTPKDQQLANQHDAHWIPRGLPGAGHVLVFNNGNERWNAESIYSSVEELIIPVGAGGRYTLTPRIACAPAQPVWSYTAPHKPDFFSYLMSSAQRLPNGNTLICSSWGGTIFEITPDNEIAWKYRYASLKSPEPAVAYDTESGAPDRYSSLESVLALNREVLCTFSNQGDPGAAPARGDDESSDNARWGATSIFRANRYGRNYPGLLGRDLAPLKIVQDVRE
jgi:hypothetical protein